MPAAAVIPALQACTNAVAVKKLVVEFLGRDSRCVDCGGQPLRYADLPTPHGSKACALH